MKGRYILACAMASLIAFAPLSLIGANAFSYAPYEPDDTDAQPNISPLAGLTYSILDMDGYLTTKECAVTYQPYALDSEANYYVQECGDLLYAFFGDLLIENFSLNNPGNFYYPQLNGVNYLLYVRQYAGRWEPRLVGTSPNWELTIEGTAIPLTDGVNQGTRVEINETIISHPFAFGEETLYVIGLDEILNAVGGYGADLVIDNSYCLFERVVFTFDGTHDFTLLGGDTIDQNVYVSGLTLDNYADFYTRATEGILFPSYPPIEPSPPSTITDGLDAILSVPIAFLNAEILPNFSFSDLLLIILGFVVFGFAVKICFGG